MGNWNNSTSSVHDMQAVVSFSVIKYLFIHNCFYQLTPCTSKKCLKIYEIKVQVLLFRFIKI